MRLPAGQMGVGVFLVVLETRSSIFLGLSYGGITMLRIFLAVLSIAAALGVVYAILEGYNALTHAEAITHQIYAVGWFVVAGTSALVWLAAMAYRRWLSQSKDA